MQIDIHLLVLLEHIKEPLKYQAALFFLKDIYIAQGVKLIFDADYVAEFNASFPTYERMRYEMLHKYKPACRLARKYEKEYPEEVIKDGEQ